MCYAIPGEIIKVQDKAVTLTYFGEVKTARNEFYTVKVGEYVYAQGGFVVGKIAKNQALDILSTWQEVFSKLKETDLRLAEEPKNLYQIANSARQRNLGNACCVHGILNFSNYCKNDCTYCGIRKSNTHLTRYRMTTDEIAAALRYKF